MKVSKTTIKILLITILISFVLCGCYSVPNDSEITAVEELDEVVESDEVEDSDIATFSKQTYYKQNNVLMSESDTITRIKDLENCSKTSAFGGEITREEIGKIVFLNSLDNKTDNAWDVSANKDGSVMAWTSRNVKNDYMCLYIAGDGGVDANKDSSYLFSYYTNLKSIEFNNCFYTGNTINMSFMFLGCESIEELRLGSFVTCSVTDMSGMFFNDTNLKKINLNSFDTYYTTNMSGMFYNCSSLKELDLNIFRTPNVVNMSYMFSGCSSLKDLDISYFDTSNADITDMFYGTEFESMKIKDDK